MSLESNEKLVDELLIGAEQAAAGRTLGLTDNQTLDLIKGRNERLRQAQRQQYAERQLREGNRAAAEEYLAQNERDVPFDRSYTDEPLTTEDLSDLGEREQPQRYQKLEANARGKRKAGQSRQAAFVMDKAEAAKEEQKAFDFGLTPLGDNAVYVTEPVEDERVGTRNTVPVYGTDENGNPVKVGERKEL